jgi:hypothetical protein
MRPQAQKGAKPISICRCGLADCHSGQNAFSVRATTTRARDAAAHHSGPINKGFSGFRGIIGGGVEPSFAQLFSAGCLARSRRQSPSQLLDSKRFTTPAGAISTGIGSINEKAHGIATRLYP